MVPAAPQVAVLEIHHLDIVLDYKVARIFKLVEHLPVLSPSSIMGQQSKRPALLARLLDADDQPRLSPEPFKVIVGPDFGVKDVNDHGAIVEQDPT